MDRIGKKKGVDYVFPLMPVMNLTMQQLELSAYLFHPKQDPSEILLRMGRTSCTRDDLKCMCLGRVITDEIIMLVTMKTTWYQHHSASQNVWCLPPRFEENINDGVAIEDLIETYGTTWMPPFKKLKYIYVLINEPQNGHWYLMVISIKDRTIYHLDSFISKENITSRRETICTVSDVISQIIFTNVYLQNFVDELSDFSSWEIKHPWVYLVPPRGYFILHFIQFLHQLKQNEEAVRMKATLGLISENIMICIIT